MEVTKEMVDRFLSWTLPSDFSPDCGINFDGDRCNKNKCWPIGTNLLTAEQARKMLEHVLALEINENKELRTLLYRIREWSILDGGFWRKEIDDVTRNRKRSS